MSIICSGCEIEHCLVSRRESLRAWMCWIVRNRAADLVSSQELLPSDDLDSQDSAVTSSVNNHLIIALRHLVNASW